MATSPISVQTDPLIIALQTLYSNSSPAEKERANAYLESVQKSVLFPSTKNYAFKSLMRKLIIA
jgi:hypothetical protein